MDAELIFWIVTTVVGWITLGVMWVAAKKDAKNYAEGWCENV